MAEIDENENKTNQMTNDDDDASEDVKDQNFMAEMVEVRVKMYACRVCGIRYDNMEAMRRHYNDIHPTSASIDDDTAAIKIEQRIKEEIMDDEEHEENHHEQMDDDVGGYVLVDDNGQHIQLPEGLQVVQIGNGGENGDQIVLQVIDQNDNVMMPGNELLVADGQPVVERRKTRQQTAAAALLAENAADQVEEKPKPTPGKRGRKRKSELTQPQTTPNKITPTPVSTRPRRMVVPNIKSEFIYEGLNQSIEVLTSSKSSKQTRLGDSSNYTLVQEESGMITAYQVRDTGRQANASAGIVKKTEDKDEQDVANEFDLLDDGEIENQDDDPADESYPSDYTPTFKTAKGRQRVEMKKGDEHLRKFPCPFQGCGYVAKYRSNLWDHKKTHTGEKPYVCIWPSCTMRFSQTHQLKLHTRSHTGERPYVCDWPGCNSAFSQKPGLKSHMLTHTGEKPFKCDYPGCGWTFRLKGALTDHKRAIHENAKKHVCEWPGCNKKFLQQCHLKKHIMGHADIKPFACDWPQCTYRAVTMAYVTNHRKTHTGEKNYECTVPNCGKRFVKSSHVNRHRQRVHPELFHAVIDGDVNVHLEMGSDMDGEDDDDDDDTNDAVASITASSATNTRSSKSRSSKNRNSQDDGDNDDAQEASENVEYMNGNDDGEESEHASENPDKNLQESRSLLVELKKEKIDD